MMFLVERKKNKQRYVCELFPHSRKFKLNTDEQFTHKMFHRLFSIVKDITKVEYRQHVYDNPDQGKTRIQNMSDQYYKNPVNNFIVRLKRDDPRTKTWSKA